jgi:hypothetical protein
MSNGGRDGAQHRLGFWLANCIIAEPAASLVKMKAHFHFNLDRDRVSVFGSRFEAPPAHGVNCLLVQTHPQSLCDSQVVRAAVRTDDGPKLDRALMFCRARFGGVGASRFAAARRPAARLRTLCGPRF